MEAYGEPDSDGLQQADWEEAVDLAGEVHGLPEQYRAAILSRMSAAVAKIGRDPHYRPCAELPMRVYALEEALDGFAYAVGEESQEGEALPHAARWAMMIHDLAGLPRRPRVYIAGPYRAATREGVAAHIEVARQAMGELLRLGYAPFCPHTMTAHAEQHFPDIPDSVYLQTDLDWLPHCDAILLLPNWERSAGATAEHRAAVFAGLRIFWELAEVPPAREYWATE